MYLYMYVCIYKYAHRTLYLLEVAQNIDRDARDYTVRVCRVWILMTAPRYEYLCAYMHFYVCIHTQVCVYIHI